MGESFCYDTQPLVYVGDVYRTQHPPQSQLLDSIASLPSTPRASTLLQPTAMQGEGGPC